LHRPVYATNSDGAVKSKNYYADEGSEREYTYMYARGLYCIFGVRDTE
jgi:hypothetical protein